MKEKEFDFWNQWMNKSKREINAIKTLQAARNLIVKNVPRNKLIAIYVGGSFVRREMTKTSDIDIWAVANVGDKARKEIKSLSGQLKKYKIRAGIGCYMLEELKKGMLLHKGQKPSKFRISRRPSPALFLKKLKNYKLIYGKSLNPEKLGIRTDKEDLKGQILHFNKLYLPLYYEGKMDIYNLAKSVVWLTEIEERVKGRDPPYSAKELSKSIRDKSHIIHDAVKIRANPEKADKNKFITKLKKHLKNLEKLL